MSDEHHIAVTKTARYHTCGNGGPSTRFVWIACHGYGQLAANFIKDFGCLDAETHYVVAPEGLSRFYWNGFFGQPAASWMTVEDRENEIADYVNYLDKVYEAVMAKFALPPKLVTFGFSQGTPTISRWIADGIAGTPHAALFWAGRLAHDLNWQNARKKLEACPHVCLVYGKSDKFVAPEMVKGISGQLDHCHIPHRIHPFEGKHEIPANILLEVAAHIGG